MSGFPNSKDREWGAALLYHEANEFEKGDHSTELRESYRRTGDWLLSLEDPFNITEGEALALGAMIAGYFRGLHGQKSGVPFPEVFGAELDELPSQTRAAINHLLVVIKEDEDSDA